MYSLLVYHSIDARNETIFDIARNRFLEFTSRSISSQLENLSKEARESIESWPCLVMQEGRGAETAYVGEITNLRVESELVRVTIRPVSSGLEITNNYLWKMRSALGIEGFEFSRNHWAIKDRDLLSILAEAGHALEEPFQSPFGQNPLPVPQRADVVRGGRTIAKWSHAEIDEFLLEGGVEGLSVPVDTGSRKDRANAIVKFALDNPTATTAENSLLSAVIARQVQVLAGEPEIPTDPNGLAPSPEDTSGRSPNRVFVVHGQNQTAKEEVVSFLRGVGLEGIVLHEQPNMGRHLLTKFIEEAELVTFAVVLMTDDDEGTLKGGDLAPRARQNVILELGYFLAYLGQAKVCALVTPGLETPSDFDGIVYIRMDDSGSWKTELKRELVAAAMPLDNR